MTPSPPVHPATRLAAFILFAALVPLLPLTLLAPLYAGLLTVLALYARLRDYGRLVWRSKFVLLTLGLAYALGGAFDTASLLSWLRASVYLLALLAALALLVLSLARAPLLCGLVTLLRPLQALGVPTHTVCVRIMLTLDYAQQLRGRAWHYLLSDVLHPGERAEQGSERIAVPQQAWRWHDTLALVLLAALLLGAPRLLAL